MPKLRAVLLTTTIIAASGFLWHSQKLEALAVMVAYVILNELLSRKKDRFELVEQLRKGLHEVRQKLEGKK